MVIALVLGTLQFHYNHYRSACLKWGCGTIQPTATIYALQELWNNYDPLHPGYGQYQCYEIFAPVATRCYPLYDLPTADYGSLWTAIHNYRGTRVVIIIYSYQYRNWKYNTIIVGLTFYGSHTTHLIWNCLIWTDDVEGLLLSSCWHKT